MRGLSTIHLSTLLLVSALLPSSLDGLEEQWIGVQIEAGNFDVEVGADGAALRVEWRGGRTELPRGIHSLHSRELEVRLGELTIRNGSFRFQAADGRTRIGPNFYEGWIELYPDEYGDGWRLVNRVPVERYLLGVVSHEMSANSFPAAALEAQAIAARTYALFQIYSRDPQKRIHVYSDTRSQVYGGENLHPAVVRAVEATRGQVLVQDGLIFESFFHSTCGGRTRSASDAFGIAELPTLEPVSCDGCQDTRFWRWQARVSSATVHHALDGPVDKLGLRLGAIRRIEPIVETRGDHAAYLQVIHGKGSFLFNADRFRSLVNRAGVKTVRSTAFSVTEEGNGFLLEGRGWGHGVGMCQMGAKGYAERGANAIWILKHYYRGAKIRSLW